MTSTTSSAESYGAPWRWPLSWSAFYEQKETPLQPNVRSKGKKRGFALLSTTIDNNLTSKVRQTPAAAACIIAGIIRPFVLAETARETQSVAMKLAWAVVKGELFEGATTPLFKQFLPSVQKALGEWVKDRVVFVASSFREGEEIIEALTGCRYSSLQSRKYLWQDTRDWLALERCKRDFWLYDGPLVTYKGDLIFPWEPRK